MLYKRSKRGSRDFLFLENCCEESAKLLLDHFHEYKFCPTCLITDKMRTTDFCFSCMSNQSFVLNRHEMKTFVVAEMKNESTLIVPFLVSIASEITKKMRAICMLRVAQKTRKVKRSHCSRSLIKLISIFLPTSKKCFLKNEMKLNLISSDLRWKFKNKRLDLFSSEQ